MKKGGRAAVVIPDGKELCENSTNSINFRKYLLYTCKVKTIVVVKSGVFKNTGITTCILYLEKYNNVTDVIKKVNTKKK